MAEVHVWKAGYTPEAVQLLGKQPLGGKGPEEHTGSISARWLSQKTARVEFLGGTNSFTQLGKVDGGPGHFWGSCIPAALRNYLSVIIC